MALTTDDRRRTNGSTVPVALATAAVASAGAGLVHAAAAGTHSGDRIQAVVFALAAAVQLGWAGVAFARPRRRVAAAGALLGAVMVGAWVVSRTAGIPVVGTWGTADPVGLQDGIAAGLALASMLTAAWHAAGRPAPRVPQQSPAVAGVAALALAIAVPGMAAPHDHGHDDGHDHGQADVELAGHEHGHEEPHGPIISLDDPRVSPTEREAAAQLIEDTRKGMERFPDVDAVVEAGYRSIGDGVTGYEHFINPRYITNGESMNPDEIESIVAQVNEDGTKEIVSAMYILAPGETMDDVPDIAGELTLWHDHQDLCWEGLRVVGTTDNPEGECRRGTFRPTPPMLHVWMVEHECGPFAGIEGSHGDSCEHEH